MGQRSGPVRFAWVVPGLALAGLPAALAEWPAHAEPAASASPGTAAVTAAVAAAGTPLADNCRTMGPALVSLVCACVFLGSLAVMVGIFRALRKQGWSLANALSEPTRLLIPDQAGWSNSQGDRQAVDAGGGGPVTSLQLMEASSSRLIALLGSVAILLLYLGFGVFTLFDFGLTCNLPATLGTITNFLYAGLALFAPYVANKISSLFRPGAKGSGADVSALQPAAFSGPPSGEAPPPLRSADSGSGDQAAATAHLPRSAALPPGPLHRAPHPIASAAAPTRTSADPGSTAAVHPSVHPLAPPAVQPPGPAARAAAERPAGAAVPHVTAAAGESVAGAARAATPPRAEGSPGVAPAHPAATASGPADSPLQPAVQLIAQFEGFVDHAYPDPASGGEPWTIGYGFTNLDGRPVRPDDRLDQSQAELLLRQGVQACAAHLAGRIPYWGEMAADQHCALISFAWNLGEDFYGDEADFGTISRVLRQRDWSDVPQALCLYINPGSSVTVGLLRRRQAEGALWEQGLAQLNRAAGHDAPSAGPSAAPSASAAAGQDSRPHAAHPNPLVVPWFDQLNMDDGQGWRDCFSASSAMLAAYWHRITNEDAYNSLRQRFGDSTSAEAQLDALRQLGLQADFRTDGTEADLQREIDAGRPVAVGWLHHGPASDPSGGGHWTVVIGYDATGVFMNDPYGNCDLVNGGYPSNHDGAGLHYSYRNWIPRWRVGGSGGWMLLCRP